MLLKSVSMEIHNPSPPSKVQTQTPIQLPSSQIEISDSPLISISYSRFDLTPAEGDNVEEAVAGLGVDLVVVWVDLVVVWEWEDEDEGWVVKKSDSKMKVVNFFKRKKR
ncbi:hypothetical protein Q3G72_024512 [Acer saccharum]|nr:hypothetical protein Q3G72_024512 [Acer saccharum]